MPQYLFYKLDKRGHIEDLPESVDCKNDDDAIAKAKMQAKSRVIEVWDGVHRVALIEPQPRNRRPRQ